MKKPHRHITSLFLTTIYLLTLFSPIVPRAVQAKLVAHVATSGECSGDCTSDGCSLERSAAHTCCCWQKKHRLNNAPLADCCASPAASPHKDRDTSTTASSAASQKKRIATLSTAPCGTGKLFSTGDTDESPHLPLFFTGVSPSLRQSTLSFIPPEHLTSLHLKPPDPPPEQA